ncbi:B-cell receptor-associated protein 31-like-domain-containing protein [Suillus occidentalis]|nr:B-cell receptor-associated protein 31-like-domain-containing protein [Suillus occidentalis]
MSRSYSLTFLLLAAEMVTFCLLVAPLPFTVRKKLFRFLSESPIIAKVAYGLKISFIFVAILFLDALQRMFRVTAETEMAKTGGQGMHDVRTESNFAARKFYAQRNTYLTGFCLFLSLVLTRTFSIILDLIHTQEEYAKLKKVVSTLHFGVDPCLSLLVLQVGAGAKGDQSKQIEELKKKLAASEAKDRDFANLKKQAAQQAAEFDRLASKYNEATGAVSDKKSD